MDINTNTKIVRDNWGQFATAMDNATADALSKVAAEGAVAAESFAPPALQGTFTSWASGRLTSAWGSSHQWAEGLNYGIPQHAIGRPGKFLYNRAEGTGPGGEGHFSARGPVLHLGYEGDHFMEESFSAVEPDILPKLREQVRSAVTGY